MSSQSQEGGDHAIGNREQKPKRVRRTRKDCDERAFVCKICQKTYLSNAALYTHVKNKHQGQKPKTQKQKSSKSQKHQKLQKQQKPQKQQKLDKSQKAQKTQKALQLHQNQQQMQQNQPILPDGQSNKQSKQQLIDINASSLERLRQFMKKYYPERNKGCTIRVICQGLVPQILEYIQPLLKEASQLKNSEVNKMKLCISQIFGIFLILMNLRVSSTCINFLIRFFFYLRNAIKLQTKKQDYCQRQNAQNLPNYFNKIVLNQRIPAPGFDQDQMMHNPMIICRVLQSFGQWLYDERYTDYKIIPNYEKQQNIA